MTSSRNSRLRAATWTAALLVACGAHASDPWPEPLPIAAETPAFRAPAKVEDAGSEQVVFPDPSGPLALQETLALALMGSPELAIFSWEARASEARALQAGAIANPELDVRLWSLGLRNGQEDVRRRRVILSQEIELGGKRQRRYDVAQAEREMAGWDYEAKRIEVATVVVQEFAAVLGAQRRVELQRELVEFLEEMHSRVLTLVESGSIRTLEMHQVKLHLGKARIDLQAAESELATARFRLAATWGSSSPRFTKAAGDLERVRPVPDIDTVMELAERSPAIARWDAELARGEAALKLAKAGRVPDLQFGAGVRWDEDVDEQDYLVDVEISLPIFDRKRGDVREARYDMARARAGRQAAAASRSAAIAELYYALIESHTRSSTLAEDIVPAAESALEAFKVGFEAMVGNLDRYLDARRDLTRARVDYTDSLVDYHRNLSALEGTVGRRIVVD